MVKGVDFLYVRREVKDDHGYTHSIDMVTIDYLLTGSASAVTLRLIELLESHGMIKDKHCKLDMLPNFRYEFYTNFISYEGFTFQLGKWSNYDRNEKKWYNLDMMRFKVNPNKHLDTPLMNDVLAFFGDWCRDGVLVRYDYAIDVPVKLEDVLVINSRKLKGLYRGTRYFGRRHNHGYLKIYDKGAESGLESILTRLEYTFAPGQIPSWDNIVIRAPINTGSGEKLSKTLQLYLDMLIELRELGSDIDQYIERMDFKSYKKIEPYLMTGVRLEFDETIVDCLLDNICDIFIVTKNQQLIKDEFLTDLETDLPLDW